MAIVILTCLVEFGCFIGIHLAWHCLARGCHCQQQEKSFENIACLRLRQFLGNVGDVGEKCLKGMHRRALERWASGLDHFMKQQLCRELGDWASSLLVMQRLEAKHHLVTVHILRLCSFISGLVEKCCIFVALLSCKYV